MAKNRKRITLRFLLPAQLIWVGLLLIGLVGCQAEATQLPESPPADLEQAPVEDTEVPAQTAESPSPGQAEEVEAPPENQCLICHTDQAALQDTADQVVATESESSGEG